LIVTTNTLNCQLISFFFCFFTHQGVLGELERAVQEIAMAQADLKDSRIQLLQIKVRANIHICK